MASADVLSPPIVDKLDAATPAVRKRRRRTAASGAAEDCFTCRKLSVACDRKRPYCSPCLAVGKECSGYRTTLTWNVGVASRGKLRGLSCPVAGKPVASDPIEIKQDARRHKRKASAASAHSSSTNSDHAAPPASASTQNAFSFAASLPTVQENVPVKVEDMPHQHHTPARQLRLDIPQPSPVWHVPQFSGTPVLPSHMQTSPFPLSPTSYTSDSLRRNPFVLSPSIDGPYPGSAHSVGTFSDAGYMGSSRDFPPSPISFSYGDPMPPYPYPTAEVIPHSIGHIVDAGNQMMSGSTSPHGASLGSEVVFGDQNEHLALNPVHLDSEPTELAQIQDFAQFEMTFDDMIGPQTVQDDQRATSDSDLGLVMNRSSFTNPFFHLSHRMQSLLDFYDKHICSVLVAFDGDTNPYRAHILNLAANNEGLQNAIAALATNNIRMRSQKRLQAAGFVEEIAESGHVALSESCLALTFPSPEEQCYKALSIEQLNMQLAHVSSADDDSVLATLLILCLFHVCDSGFSKFKVQLAGVQKLLTLRSKDNKDTSSGFIGWVQMFFTWFDVMTSTVNDREVEINHPSLGLFNYTTDLGDLEQFSGCDGRLFKYIARLGRLNLLAQQRPVRNSDNTFTTPTQWHEPAPRLKPQPKYPFNFRGMDGNGWSQSLDDFNDDPYSTTSGYPDGRLQFWTEWHDIRHRLQTWCMDYSSIPGPRAPGLNGPVTSSSSLGPEQRDLVHINESFRSSALLYTERLANPGMHSSSPNFQQLVAQGLFHITAISVTSCVNKFLLWPLFIIGTEAVDPSHRATVRSRCVEIQRESGFFNNLSVLEVLERAWNEPEEEVDVTCATGQRQIQTFKWRKAMSRVDGEYIVV